MKFHKRNGNNKKLNRNSELKKNTMTGVKNSKADLTITKKRIYNPEDRTFEIT